MLSVAQLDERIEKCLSILAVNPHSQVFAALADGYRKRGDLGRAFAVCKSGLKHHPDYAPAHMVMARLYVHQGMLTDALNSLEHAVALDGPTHATDLLAVEVHLALGDAVAVAAAIERLRAADPRDPQVREFERRLKAMRQTPPPVLPQTPIESPKVFATTPAARDRTMEPISWEQWAEKVAASPQVERAFAFEAASAASYTVLVDTGKRPSAAGLAGPCLTAFCDIESAVRRVGNEALDELRIETSGRELWCRRHGDCVIGFIGGEGVAFGAVRQIALDHAGRIASVDAAVIESGNEAI